MIQLRIHKSRWIRTSQAGDSEIEAVVETQSQPCCSVKWSLVFELAAHLSESIREPLLVRLLQVASVIVPVFEDPAPECCVAIHGVLFLSLYPKKDESQEKYNTIAEEAVELLQAL